MLTIKKIEIINKKKIAKTALDENIESFIVYMTSLLTIALYSAKKAQIALLVTKKVKILPKFLDFLDVFSKKRLLCY